MQSAKCRWLIDNCPQRCARRGDIILKQESYALSCAICEIRKEKRFCPAVHGRICPQCCGEQREVTLDCPSDCPYLQQAREHEKPRSADQLDEGSIFRSSLPTNVSIFSWG